jgi:CHRD domain
MNKLLVLAIGSIFSATFASAILAETTVFAADLKGTSQVPPIDSAATGKAEVTYDDASKMLTWTITYTQRTNAIAL